MTVIPDCVSSYSSPKTVIVRRISETRYYIVFGQRIATFSAHRQCSLTDIVAPFTAVNGPFFLTRELLRLRLLRKRGKVRFWFVRKFVDWLITKNRTFSYAGHINRHKYISR